MKNNCEKNKFPTELDAKIALMKIHRRDNPRRLKQEKRSYQCPDCNQWHLTSSKFRTYIKNDKEVDS